MIIAVLMNMSGTAPRKYTSNPLCLLLCRFSRFCKRKGTYSSSTSAPKILG